MNTKFILNVDVPGEMGGNTLIDTRFNPNKLYHLHLVFDQYPDDIFKCSPVYIVSESLYNSAIDLGLSGLNNARLISYSLNDYHYQTIQNDEKIPTQNYFMVDINENQEDDTVSVSSVFDSSSLISRIRDRSRRAVMRVFSRLAIRTLVACFAVGRT